MVSAPSTSGNDVIFATEDGEAIDGLGGNDLLRSSFPTTKLIGSVGNDALLHSVALTSSANVVSELNGGAGNDFLSGNFRYFLTEGSSSDAVSIDGDEGNDLITASLQIDISGDSEFLIGRGWQIEGGAGNDTVLLTANIPTDDQNFVVFGEAYDVIPGGNDTIITKIDGRGIQQDLDGGPGNDFISTQITADGFLGNAYGGSGNDAVNVNITLRTADSFCGVRIEGEEGNDSLIAEVGGPQGGTGFVNLFGGSGRDLLSARIGEGVGGTVRLVGDPGDDVLSISGGGLDADNPNWIEGGAGRDRMTGSQNADVFAFLSVTEDGDPAELADDVKDRDVVTNFARGLDKIALPEGSADVTTWKVTGSGLLLTFDGDGDQLLLRNVFSYEANDFILLG